SSESEPTVVAVIASDITTRSVALPMRNDPARHHRGTPVIVAADRALPVLARELAPSPGEVASIRAVARTGWWRIAAVGSGIDLPIAPRRPSAAPGTASPLAIARRAYRQNRIRNCAPRP